MIPTVGRGNSHPMRRPEFRKPRSLTPETQPVVLANPMVVVMSDDDKEAEELYKARVSDTPDSDPRDDSDEEE